jgi:hypothetical protein
MKKHYETSLWRFLIKRAQSGGGLSVIRSWHNGSLMAFITVAIESLTSAFQVVGCQSLNGLMADHLIIDASQQPNLIRCTHCGAQEPLNLPMPIRQLVAIERDWRARHARCRPPTVQRDA